MRCPFCQHAEDRVVDSRTSREGRAVRRRRECLGCGRRYTTYEYIEERPLQVVKRNGEVEPYDRRKLLHSIELAAVKRPISASDVDRMVEEIEHLLDRSDASEIGSERLGELVMERLKSRDHIAYVRFASVYRNFQDLTEFYDELKELDARSAQMELRRYQQELPLGSAEEEPAPDAPEAAPEREPSVPRGRSAAGGAAV
ncbi:MAG TPA: transcriptional regulator NrdR [Longimicrobiaceae bacterium]|nr:transcriptional regulator NrdR [Longimicrobiaceae bacterium]